MNTQLDRQDNSALGSRVERATARHVLAPVVDITETTEELVLTADMPGVDEGSVDVTLEQDVLTIEGRMANETLQGYSLSFHEYDQGDYRRVFTLATEIDREHISAQVKNGVLQLVLPKAEPAKAKKIKVSVG